MVRYRRNFVPGGTYFFTVTLPDRTSAALVHRLAIFVVHVYVRRGVLPANWAGDVEEPTIDFGERRG